MLAQNRQQRNHGMSIKQTKLNWTKILAPFHLTCLAAIGKFPFTSLFPCYIFLLLVCWHNFQIVVNWNRKSLIVKDKEHTKMKKKRKNDSSKRGSGYDKNGSSSSSSSCSSCSGSSRNGSISDNSKHCIEQQPAAVTTKTMRGRGEEYVYIQVANSLSHIVCSPNALKKRKVRRANEKET